MSTTVIVKWLCDNESKFEPVLLYIQVTPILISSWLLLPYKKSFAYMYKSINFHFLQY